MGKKVKYDPVLRKHVNRHHLQEKLGSIIRLLGPEAQPILDWAQDEARRQQKSGELDTDLGRKIFHLIAHEAAVRLVQRNHERGKLTTKSEIRKKTGLKVEMPVLYRDAGLRHPQEARNLRHNIFHESFIVLIDHLFPNSTTSVPSTGHGALSPDLLVEHKDPNWSFVVEYKGYRSITLLGESELLKGMRYQAEYGTAWLVTSSTKSVRDVYGRTLDSERVIENGLARLRNFIKRKTFTEEQRENRGIARKGIKHLEKHRGINLRCKMIPADEMLESFLAGKPIKALAITTGLELVQELKEKGYLKEADNLLRIMKIPAKLLHSDSVTSIRLIE